MNVIGCHLSTAKGLPETVETANRIGAETFQFFSRNPRGSSVRQYTREEKEEFEEKKERYCLKYILAHAPYTMNLAAKQESVYEFAGMVLKEDMKRMDELGIDYFNIHPGSHVGEGVEKGIDRIAAAVNHSLRKDQNILLLLETMSGKGTEIGYEFEQLQKIIEKTELKEKIGVCLDTCHVFAAGYDLVNHLDEVLEEFDSILGLDRLKAVHLNDSMMPFGSRKDRHSPIGEGEIGLDAVIKLMKHPVLKDLPFYLETPFNEEGHKKEIAALKRRLKY
jgi:deoxyribonuclease-4